MTRGCASTGRGNATATSTATTNQMKEFVVSTQFFIFVVSVANVAMPFRGQSHGYSRGDLFGWRYLVVLTPYY